MTKDEAESAAVSNARITADGLFGTLLECQGLLAVVRWDDGHHSMLSWTKLALASPKAQSRSRNEARATVTAPPARNESYGSYEVQVKQGSRWEAIYSHPNHQTAVSYAKSIESAYGRVRVIHAEVR